MILVAVIFGSGLLLRTPADIGMNTKPSISRETLQYFGEVAIGYEFGPDRQVVLKWTKPDVSIAINGSPKPEDTVCLANVMSDFNSVSEESKLVLTDKLGDINIYFVPEAEFISILPEYQPVNEGYFWVYPNNDGAIDRATVLINSTRISSQERCHLIREETTQAMGIMKDSHRYEDSIFYDEWTETNTYSTTDFNVIKMMYGGNEVLPGDSQSDVASKFIVE